MSRKPTERITQYDLDQHRTISLHQDQLNRAEMARDHSQDQLPQLPQLRTISAPCWPMRPTYVQGTPWREHNARVLEWIRQQSK